MVIAITIPSLHWAKSLLQLAMNEKLKPQHRQGNKNPIREHEDLLLQFQI